MKNNLNNMTYRKSNPFLKLVYSMEIGDTKELPAKNILKDRPLLTYHSKKQGKKFTLTRNILNNKYTLKRIL